MKIPKKDKVITVVLVSSIIVIVVGTLGYFFWIALEAPEKNNNLAEEICSKEKSAVTGIRENGQYGLFAYACGLEVGRDYVIYINSSNDYFNPLKFKAENSFKMYQIGFDKYSPEQDWFLYLYSKSDQTYLATGNYHFEGGSMVKLFPRIFGDLIPLMIILSIILGSGILFETYILKKRILRKLIFPFESKKEEKEEDV